MKLDTVFLVYAGDAMYRLEVGEDRVEANGKEVVIVNSDGSAIKIWRARTARKAARLSKAIEKKFRTWSELIARHGGELTFEACQEQVASGIVRYCNIA